MSWENFRMEGIRAARAVIPEKRKRISFIKRVKSLRKKMKAASLREKSGWLHDNDYLAHRAAAAFLPVYRTRTALRMARGRSFLEVMLERYMDLPGADASRDKIGAFFAGVREERGLEEREARLLRPLLALFLMRDLSEERDAERAVSGLRTLFPGAWDETEESLSDLAEVFRKDPLYPRMDKETRAAYRAEAERTARKKGVSEREEAAYLLHRAETEGKSLGALLFPSYGKLSRAWSLLFLAPWGFATAASAAFYPFVGLLLSSLAWPLFYELFSGVVPAVWRKLRRPHPLFGMDFEDGVPEEEKTLTVVTSVVKDAEDAALLVTELEERFLAEGKDPALPFGLLLDRPDDEKTDPDEEDEVREKLRKELLRLKEKYGVPFYGFLRKRRFVPADGIFRGWERKRGALVELTEAIRRGGGMEGDLTGENVSGIRYLVTLDRDTKPWPGSVRRLVEKAAHPENRPVVRNGRVVKGYGVIAPALRFSPAAIEATAFGEIVSGGCGIDLYNGQESDRLFALTGRGVYPGKGLIRADTAAELLPKAFPEGKILSHDVPEGGLLGTAASEAVFFEDAPATAASFWTRSHRWARGDTQNLWLLFAGKLDLWTGWLISENVRKLFLKGQMLLLFAAGTLSGNGILWIPPLLLLLRPLLNGILTVAFQKEEYLERRLTARFSPLERRAAESFLSLVFLPFGAFLSLDAFARSAFRMLFSGKKLLEWSPFGKKDWTLGHSAGRMLPAAAAASLACPLLAPVWLPGFAAGYYLSRRDRPAKIDPADAAYLKNRVADAMDLFLILCRKEWGYLPADNFQLYPYKGTAKITSPTDMGMTLLAFVAFDDLGLPGADRFLTMGEKMLRTMEKLPKKWGLFYNWYDLETLSPAPPRVLSSVDSGNLAASLLAVAEAYREKGYPDPGNRAEKMALEMDFGKLYDKESGLLSVGYDADRNALMPNSYDLYQSEARIASYLAVALGKIPAGHWEKLGRPVKGFRGYAGLASWSGTMFEALLPDLFFPAPRGTLSAEGSRFAVLMHKISGQKRGRPWGISESCFYAFDGAFSYRYKAHGVSGTALAPDRSGEYVFAPYAAFLALGTEENAVSNLRYAESLGAVGKYGFYEALDATDPRKIRPVRAYMSHHTGMIAAAADRFLVPDVFQKRLARYPALRAFRILTWESVRSGPRAEETSGEAPPGRLGEGSRTRWFPRPEKAGSEKLLLFHDGKEVEISGDGRIESEDPVWDGLALFCTADGERRNLTAYPYYDESDRETVFTSDGALFGLRIRGVSLEAVISGKEKLSVFFSMCAEGKDVPDITVGWIGSTGKREERRLIPGRDGVAEAALTPS